MSPAARVRPRFFSSALPRPMVEALSPITMSSDALRSQRSAHFLPSQLTEAPMSESGAPSVRMKRPSFLNPTASSARRMSPVRPSPGTSAATDSSGKVFAETSSSVPAGLGPPMA